MGRVKSFFEIQRSQRRRGLLLLAALGLLYFVVLFGLLYGLRVVAVALGGGEWRTIKTGRHSLTIREVHWDTPRYLRESALFALALGGGMLLLQYRFARNSAVQSILDDLKARPPEPSDRYHRRFMNLVEEMAVAGGLRPAPRPVVMPSLALSAFAAEDRRSGAILGVTEGLLAQLNRSQVQAVVAHEMAHIRAGDAALSAFTCALLAPFATMAEMVARLEPERPPDAPGRDGYQLSELLLALTRLAAAAVSRNREIEADAAAVEMTRHPLALAEALLLVSRGNHFLGGLAAAYSPIFILDPTRSTLCEGEGFTSNLLSSHPPVRKRIDALLRMAGMSAREFDARPAWDTGPDSDDAPPAGAPSAVADPELAAALAEAFAAIAGDGTGGGEPCPRCRAPLCRVDYEGLATAQCTKCGGRLVENAALPRILARREARFTEETRRKAWDLVGRQILRDRRALRVQPDEGNDCPRCHQPMLRQFYNYQFPLVVDRCYGCGIAWFDSDELEMLQVLAEEGAR
jgi:Zn-dependent protease with chaperone function/Zn-finger nucleic acid-binding protein